MKIVSERLRALRHSIGISQKALANKFGITQSSLNRYENDWSEATYETLLLYAFDVSMDYIFGRTDHRQGRQYCFRPTVGKDNDKEMREFIEMCFDPASAMNVRLKEMLFDMMKGGGEE